MSLLNSVLADAEMQRRARKEGSTTVVLPAPPDVIPNTTTATPAAAKKGRVIRSSMLSGASGITISGGTFTNAGGSVYRYGAKVEGVTFFDAPEGSEDDEIEADYLENASNLVVTGGKLENVGGGISYMPAGQNGIASESGRAQRGPHIHAHMFTGLKNSKFSNGEFTNVGGSIIYVGHPGPSTPFKGKEARKMRADEPEGGHMPGGW